MSGLDRTSVLNAIESMFESDSTLYGSSSLINYISDNIVDYESAKVGIDKPYKMYLKAPRREKVDVRMSNNVDYNIFVEYRIEGLKSNPQTAIEKIDDIEDRIQHLCDNEMWMGNNLGGHFTNAESSVINIEWESGNADTRIDEGGIKVEAQGTIRVEINRIKP
jgi:hypothetical protein